MNNTQLGIIGTAVLLFAFLYFGFDTKPSDRASIEKARALVAESTDIKVLLKEAKAGLASEDKHQLLSLETLLNQADTDSLKLQAMEKISGLWFMHDRAGISAYYAEKIAESRATEEAWSIAATTYALCVQKTTEDKIKSFCSDRAVAAYENAISLNPDNLTHKMNLGLSYAEYPPKENPMKGIMMLLDLNKQHPEYVPAIINLARLGLKTGQVDKAIQRLTKAETLEPANVKVKCMLADAFQRKGDAEKAESYLNQCQKNKINPEG